jgi:hypothetical protein
VLYKNVLGIIQIDASSGSASIDVYRNTGKICLFPSGAFGSNEDHKDACQKVD